MWRWQVSLSTFLMVRRDVSHVVAFILGLRVLQSIVWGSRRRFSQHFTLDMKPTQVVVVMLIVVVVRRGIVAWQGPHHPRHGLAHVEEPAGDLPDRVTQAWPRDPPGEWGQAGQHQHHQQSLHTGEQDLQWRIIWGWSLCSSSPWSGHTGDTAHHCHLTARTPHLLTSSVQDTLPLM